MKISLKYSLGAVSAALMMGMISTPPAHAQEPYLGQLMVFGGTFCPRGWTNADGQLLAVASNSALFSLYGCMYGGDCRTTFGVPNLKGRSVVHVGNGAGLPPTPTMGATGGSGSFTITTNTMPSHNHAAFADPNPADNQNATGDLMGGGNFYRNSPNPSVTFNNTMIGHTGGSQPINKRSPMQVIRYCVATQGIYPSRN